MNQIVPGGVLSGIACYLDSLPVRGESHVFSLAQMWECQSLEYAWWVQRDLELFQVKGIKIRAIGIGDRAAGLTQLGATFMFDGSGNLIYEHRDPGILGFAENMSYPLSFL